MAEEAFFEDDEVFFSDDSEPSDPLPSQENDYAEIFDEIEQLQDAKSGWGTAIAILVVSVALFLGLGAWQWSWEMTAILIPILFIHELGHYIAMRVFRYRNVKMFFIPLFGAAVSGRHYNVAGWKKAVVSLMGPVPGIMLAGVAAVVGLFFKHDLIFEVALWTLIINGINLLPVLPLDGGWVMHSIVFCRHYMLDGAFRLVAAAALLVCGLFIGPKFLMFIAGISLLALPATIRMARIAARLREQGLSARSADAQTIPHETAVAIIEEVQRSAPAGMTSKIVAQQTLSIFESLNARPPGILASIALLGVYGGSFLAAIVFIGVLAIGQRGGDLGQFMQMAAEQPQHAVECGSIQQAPAGVPEGASSEFRTIVANFGSAEEAEQVFAEIADELPPQTSATLFGETILVEFPTENDAARKQIFAELEGKSDDVFAEVAELGILFRLLAVAPNEETAEAIEQAAADYFMLPSTMKVIPPWSPEDDREPDLREKHELALRTYRRLQDFDLDIGSDGRIDPLNEKLQEAFRTGDLNEVNELHKQRQKIVEELQRKAFAKLRAEGPESVDVELIDLYEAWWNELVLDDEERDRAQIREIDRRRQELNIKMGARMGQIPVQDMEPAAGSDRYLTTSGSVTRNGVLLQIDWITFQREPHGAAALLDWLCEQDCMDIKYEFSNGIDF